MTRSSAPTQNIVIGAIERTEAKTATGFLRWLRSPRPYLLLLGFAIFLAAWHFAVLDVATLRRIAPPAVVLKEWFNPQPFFGVSVYTPLYYSHIAYSVYRAYTAFALALLLGVPLGILIGWNRRFREFAFPVVEILRPIPPLSWVPLAILMLAGTEPPVIFVTFIAAFFATVLNTVLGVQSIDQTYFRAAQCLGFKRREILVHVVIPGAMPHVFTGLQIAMGLSWVALVAGEMIAGKRGLGYMIYDAYSMVQIPTIIMGMLTLGLLGFLSSAAVRYVGRRLMAWRSF